MVPCINVRLSKLIESKLANVSECTPYVSSIQGLETFQAIRCKITPPGHSLSRYTKHKSVLQTTLTTYRDIIEIGIVWRKPKYGFILTGRIHVVDKYCVYSSHLVLIIIMWYLFVDYDDWNFLNLIIIIKLGDVFSFIGELLWKQDIIIILEETLKVISW